MSYPLSDGFNTSTLMDHKFILTVSGTQAGPGWTPASFNRTVSYDGYQVIPDGTTGPGDGFVGFFFETDGLFGPVGNLGITGAPNNKYIIYEKTTTNYTSKNHDISTYNLKTFYTISYTRAGSTYIDITNANAFSFDGVGIVGSTDGDIIYESISAKVTIYSNLLGMIGKLESNYLLLSSLLPSQEISLSNFAQTGYFNPNKVVRVDVQFYIARKLPANSGSSIDYKYSLDRLVIY